MLKIDSYLIGKFKEEPIYNYLHCKLIIQSEKHHFSIFHSPYESKEGYKLGLLQQGMGEIGPQRKKIQIKKNNYR